MPANLVRSSVTLTNNSKAIVRGGAKGATTEADVTSTASGANHQALDVIIYDTSGNPITSFGGGGGGTQYADGASQATPTGNQINWNQSGTQRAVSLTQALPIQPGTGATFASTQSGTWNIADITGTVSLPTGAATETTLAAVNTKLPSNLTVTSTRLLVDGSGVTQPVSATSLPLPTGASTSALQTTGNTSLGNLDTNIGAQSDAVATSDTGTFSLLALFKRLLSVTLAKGQQLMAASLPVTIASNQSKVDTKQVVEQLSGFAQTLSAPGASTAIDSTPYSRIIIWYTVASVDTSVTLRVEGSGDGTNWANLDSLGEDTVITANGSYYFILDNVPAFRVRFNFVSEAGGAAATVALTATAS
jgi:hypothetical protein